MSKLLKTQLKGESGLLVLLLILSVCLVAPTSDHRRLMINKQKREAKMQNKIQGTKNQVAKT